MLRLGARLALASIALAFSLAGAGCASWREAWSQPLPPMRASAYAPPPVVASATPQLSPRVTSHGPEDFLCVDASQISVTYSEDNATANLGLAGATPIAMQRVNENGVVAYRAGDLVFLRAGARAVLRSGQTNVTVRAGDSLSRISIRLYGDRTHAMDIARANADQISDPNLIVPGQVLHLPVAERRCRRVWRDQAATPISAVAPG